MFKKKRARRKSEVNYETIEDSIGEVFKKARKSSDFSIISPLGENHSLLISYYKTLIDPNVLQRSVLPFLKENASEIKELADLKKVVPIESITFVDDPSEMESALHRGCIVIYFKDKEEEYAFLDISYPRWGQRETNETENEFSVIGPQVGFIEDLSTNLHLIRGHLNSSDLIFEELEVGSRSKTKVVIAYLDGVTSPEYVNTMRQRLNELDIDVSLDSTQLEQLIADNSGTPFPLFVSTERVDRTVWSLTQGQVVLISDKSSYAVIGPTNLMDFFSNPEDYYLPSLIASFLKLIRIFGMLFSIFATSFYVAILTYHYEVVPKDLLGSIIYSRANVPFPPLAEALFLEVTIDLLREAGARLPKKIGQTLGIVGGIVIGQATVDAALTSNILLIIVALAALSSFTTPIYKMSNAIRLLRYPLILLAAFWGGLGIFAGSLFLIAHLARLDSLGAPYLVPLYPYRKGGVATSFVRLGFPNYDKRPWYLRPLSAKRYAAVQNKDTEKGLDNE